MTLDTNIDKPIFLQIKEVIEDAIVSGAFTEGSQIPSITEFSVMYKINPATALKGINLLVDDNIVYKKRGVGMFVSEGAVSKLTKRRRDEFYDKYIESLVAEAKRINLSSDEIITMIKRGLENEH